MRHNRYVISALTGILPTLVALLSCPTVLAQDAATGYGYLQLPVSARSAALGGTVISVVEPDVTLAEQNPSLLCPEMSHQLALSYSHMMGDAQLGYAAYAGTMLGVGAWSVGMRYIDYGHFDGYDEWGNATGAFGVKDMSLQGAIGYPINDRLRIGAQVKLLYTSYESYTAFAMGVDVGLNWYDEVSGNSFALTATNLGGQFTPLYDERPQSLPTQLNAGWTRELRHLPFCVSVTAHRLLDWDHDFIDGNGQRQSYTNAELLFNHLNFGLEWAASDHFWLAASYNYRHQRTFIGQGGFLRGVGLGAGLRYRQLDFALAYAAMHAGDATLSLQFNYTF